jgi:bifunctional non-homologous end joining protein LigD
LPSFRPMLASTGALRGTAWVFEPKFDGWRVLVSVNGRTNVRTRHGNDITERLPELAPLGDELGGTSVILDGELVARQGRARDFYCIAPELSARRKTNPLPDKSLSHL